ALLHQPIGQGHVAADHQVAGLGVLDQVIVGRVGPARHHDQAHAGERRLDLALPGHQQHLELALERELDHLVLGRPRAGIGIDPDTHRTQLPCLTPLLASPSPATPRRRRTWSRSCDRPAAAGAGCAATATPWLPGPYSRPSPADRRPPWSPPSPRTAAAAAWWGRETAAAPPV